MKTLFTLLAFTVLISITSIAQLDKGYWIGNIEGNVKNINSGGYWSINLNPQMLKLVTKNLAVGAEINFRYYKSNYTYYPGELTGAYQITKLDFGPVGRKYFGSYKVKPYIELSTGVSMSNYRYHNTENPGDLKYKWYLKPSIGVSWWINENVSLNASAGYYFLNYSQEPSDGLKIGVGFKIGNSKIKK